MYAVYGYAFRAWILMQWIFLLVLVVCFKNAFLISCYNQFECTYFHKDMPGYQRNFMKRGAIEVEWLFGFGLVGVGSMRLSTGEWDLWYPFDIEYFVFLNKQLKNEIK